MRERGGIEEWGEGEKKRQAWMDGIVGRDGWMRESDEG